MDDIVDRQVKVVGVSGSNGFVGSFLGATLSGAGLRVVGMLRPPSQPGTDSLMWDPETGRVEGGALGELDAVVHLAGENLASRRWTDGRKRSIRASRVDATRRLCRFLAGLQRPPAVLVSASAVGYYGDRGSETVDEDSPPGEGFLASVCREWEAATEPARGAGIRVANLRLGMVLGPKGGALAQMLPAFRLGLGGPLGSGRQFVSWVSLEDVAGAVQHVLKSEELSGPVNVVAPAAVPQREFARCLGKALSRPSFLPVPSFVLRLLFGEMARELLLSGARVHPARLLASGYRFRHPELEGAFRSLLGER